MQIPREAHLHFYGWIVVQHPQHDTFYSFAYQASLIRTAVMMGMGGSFTVDNSQVAVRMNQRLR